MDEIIKVIPEKYRTLAIVALAISPYLTRAAHALMNGRGLKGVLSAIWLGTNTPTKSTVSEEPTTSPKSSTLPILFLVGSLALTMCLGAGCGTTPLNVATKADGAVIITVDGAMKGWRDYVTAGKATKEQIDAVHDAYVKYYNAQKLAEQALLEYSALTADEQVSQSAKVQSLVDAARAAEEPLINLIQLFINKKVGL